ncbi:RraA family protein [Isosphaera pallida]|nr:RraA family protein [Isosphaera pallida]
MSLPPMIDDHPPRLSAAQLDELRGFTTPTIANAIELFEVRPRHTGFLPHTIRALTPHLGVTLGYAVTCRTIAAPPGADFDPITSADRLMAYYRYVAASPGPKVAVAQDLDDPPGLGAFFGELNASVHQRLGCVGHVTSGCPRDLGEVEALGFALYGLNPCVSHAYIRVESFGEPVVLGGVTIQPGDLIHADRHGVCVIPREIEFRLAEACREVERAERPLLELCRAETFDLDAYLIERRRMKPGLRE